MKRSKMQLIIQDSLERVLGIYPGSLEMKHSVDIVLKSIEKAGMLPPSITKPLKYHNGEQFEVETVNEWEEE